MSPYDIWGVGHHSEAFPQQTSPATLEWCVRWFQEVGQVLLCSCLKQGQMTTFVRSHLARAKGFGGGRSTTSVTKIIGRPENRLNPGRPYFCRFIRIILHSNPPRGAGKLQGTYFAIMDNSWCAADTAYKKILWRQPETGKDPPSHSSHLPSLHSEAMQAPLASAPASAQVEPTLATCGAGGSLGSLCWIYNEVLKFRIHMRWLVEDLQLCAVLTDSEALACGHFRLWTFLRIT